MYICINLQFDSTLLHDAACGGNVELVKWLVEEKGFDVQEWNEVLCSLQVAFLHHYL